MGPKIPQKIGGNNFFPRVPPLDFQKCSIFPPTTMRVQFEFTNSNLHERLTTLSQGKACYDY